MTERAGPCGATIGTEGAVGLVTTLVLESAPGRSGAPSKCCWWGGLGRASGTSERQGESRYMPSEERVWPARGRTRVELGSRRIPCVALPLLTRSSDGWVANCVRRPPPAEPGCWAQAEGKKVKVGSGAGRCLGNPADSDRGARREMAGHSECLARSGGRAVGAQLKNGEETVVTNDVHVAVRERHIPLWIGSGGGRRRAQDATGVVYL